MDLLDPHSHVWGILRVISLQLNQSFLWNLVQSITEIYVFHMWKPGADPGFSFQHAHTTSVEPNSLSAGVQGPLKGPGSSGVVLMVSRAIWALFLSILINIWLKNIADPILGRGGGVAPVASGSPPPPPPGSATENTFLGGKYTL